ncbi:hypothetical protein D3C81_2202020 [compost metagenome]
MSQYQPDTNWVPWAVGRPMALMSVMNTMRLAMVCPPSIKPNCLAVEMALTRSEPALARPMIFAPEACA